MRGLFTLALLSSLAACERPCKQGTVYLRLQFKAEALEADEVELVLSLGGAVPQKSSFSHKPGDREGTIEVQFASGYEEGVQLVVAVNARRGGLLVAAAAAPVVLGSGCSVVSISVGDGPPPKRRGETCDAATDTCEAGYCVDGFCCDRLCEGQCQACDVSGAEGTCTTVTGQPRGGRGACAGDGTVCAGACDGKNPSACTYPTTVCREESCSDGVRTEAATCSDGICPPPATRTCGAKECAGSQCATIVSVAGRGLQHTCAALSSGSVYCWGFNGYEQLGLGAGVSAPKNVPTKVSGISNAVEVAAGTNHTCARLADNTVMCWGHDNAGQLGRGVQVDQSGEPAFVVDESGMAGTKLSNVASLGLGHEHSCVVLANNQARCWGLLGEGEGGAGQGVTVTSKPVPMCPIGSTGTCTVGADNIKQVAGGNYHSCVVTTSGKIACTGLFFSTHNLKDIPFVGLGGARSISAFGDDTCAQLGDGSVMCWGTNSAGQHGNTTKMASTSPRSVCSSSTCSILTGASQVGLGYNHGCALVFGDVRCWGANSLGQLGDGTKTERLYAAPSLAMGVTQLAVGGYHACAVFEPEVLRCWGSNGRGELGNGDPLLESQAMPVDVKW